MKCKKCDQEVNGKGEFCKLCGDERREDIVDNKLKSEKDEAEINLKELESRDVTHKEDSIREMVNAGDEVRNAYDDLKKQKRQFMKKVIKIVALVVVILSCVDIIYNKLTIQKDIVDNKLTTQVRNVDEGVKIDNNEEKINLEELESKDVEQKEEVKSESKDTEKKKDNISEKDIDRALSSMDTTKIIKILDKINDNQIRYFEDTSKKYFKKYLLGLGYRYNDEGWIYETDEKFVENISLKLRFLDNQRLTKAGIIYEIKQYADSIVAANKVAEEVDFKLANKYYDIEHRNGYVISRVGDANNPNGYVDLYYVEPMDGDEGEPFLIEEKELGRIKQGIIEGNFIYLREEQITQNGFGENMRVYKYLTLDEYSRIEREYLKIEQKIPAIMGELQSVITEFINKE